LRQLLFDVDLRLCGRRASFDQEPELVRGYRANTLQEGAASEPAKKINGVILRASDEDARRTSTSKVPLTSPLEASGKQMRIASQTHCADAAREGTASAVSRSVESPGAFAPEVPPQELAFTGIHIISPRLLRMMQEEGVFSIIDSYLNLSARGENILAFPADDAYWRDLGKPADLAQAARDRALG
jgi:hypothetical protein